MAGFISKVPDRANSSCRCVKPAVIVRAILHRSSQETTCDFKKSQRDPKEDFRINMEIRNADDIINKNKKMNNNLFINKSAKGYRLADIYKGRLEEYQGIGVVKCETLLIF